MFLLTIGVDARAPRLSLGPVALTFRGQARRDAPGSWKCQFQRLTARAADPFSNSRNPIQWVLVSRRVQCFSKCKSMGPTKRIPFEESNPASPAGHKLIVFRHRTIVNLLLPCVGLKLIVFKHRTIAFFFFISLPSASPWAWLAGQVAVQHP